MRILMVASEAVPFAKTGGLADVIGALPRALVRLGHDVDVVIPRYRGVTAGTHVARLKVARGVSIAESDVFAAIEDGVRTLLVDHPGYFDRDSLYSTGGQDYDDNAERFAWLAQAAITWAMASGVAYDVVHAHDWQTGLVPVVIREQGLTSRLPTVFTIHNLAYQGVFDSSWLSRLGLGASLMRVDALEYWGRISYLKAGIVFSRVITTVSPRYAREIQQPELGFGFDSILRGRASDLVGILNGIDYDRWNPATDPNLPVPYSASQLAGKDAARRTLLEAYGFGAPDEVARPVVAMISRLVDQKGFDLLAALESELPKLPATFVLLGTGDQTYEDLWRRLAAKYPGRIAARIGFDERLAHVIEAGADLFLMPSRFEPCGLNQMYSLRYGTVPLVRATGGLFDTVRNYDPRTGAGTGFVFEDYSPRALLGTLRWAIDTFRNRDAWRRLQQAGMSQDLSWDASAREYVKVYERAVSARR